MKILVTTGSWNAPLVIMESLARQGHHVYLLDQDLFCAGFRSKHCKGGILCPPESSSVSYVAAVVEIVRSGKFDLLIPASDLATASLSASRERLEPFVSLFLSSKGSIELASNKKNTYRFALEHNIAIPRTFFPETLTDVSEFARDAVFPCVAKKSRGTANKGNAYFSDRQSLLRYYEGLTPTDDWPVIQDFIDGDFYGFLGIAREGEIVDCLMYTAPADTFASGGTPSYCRSVRDDGFLDTARRIVKALNWTGAINLDFIRDGEGRFLLLEINPRLSGSLTFAYDLGVDLPSLYLALARGQEVPSFSGVRYRAGVVFRYVLSSEIIELFQNKKNALKFFGNFFDPRIRTDIPWRDPSLLTYRLKHLWWHWQDLAKGAGERVG